MEEGVGARRGEGIKKEGAGEEDGETWRMWQRGGGGALPHQHQQHQEQCYVVSAGPHSSKHLVGTSLCQTRCPGGKYIPAHTPSQSSAGR